MKNIAFDLNTAFKKLVAYEELNDNKENKTYHLYKMLIYQQV